MSVPTRSMPEADDDALADFLCFDLYAASRAITGVYRHLLEPLGLTYPQYLVLVLLWQREALTVREIIEQLHLDYGTVSPLLKRLESRGLVKRRRRPDDERSVAITLTDDGRALKGQTAGFDDVLPRAFGLDQAQSIQFRQMLSRVRSQAASVAAELAAQTHTVHGPQT